jgi:hypothetical protein
MSTAKVTMIATPRVLSGRIFSTYLRVVYWLDVEEEEKEEDINC